MNAKNPSSRAVITTFLVSLLALPLSAQVTGAANTAATSAAQANAAAQAAAARPVPPAVTTPPVAPAVPVAPTAATNAAISTGAQTSAETASQQASGAVNGSVAGSAGMQADTSGVAANANGTTNLNNNATVAGQMPGVTTAGTNSTGIAASLNSADTVTQINGAAFATRDSVVTHVNGQIATGNQALGNFRTTGRALSGDARKQFDAAYDDARAKEKDLQRSLREVRRAKDDSFEDARTKLVSDYDAYVQALSRAEAAAQANAAANVQ